MKRRLDLSLILPCYNEAGLFTESVRRIRDVLDGSRLSYEIIFVDDNSYDGTQKLIQALTSDVFRAIFHHRNFGRGRTVSDGIRAAQGEVVGYIDIDCEVSPVYILGMVRLIRTKKADVVIGRRYYRTSAGSIVRELLSRGYQWLSDKAITTGGLDTETGYKFFNRKKILPILKLATHKGWFWDTEIMVYAKRRRLTILEEPVLFLRRFDKQSSVNILADTWDYIVNLVRLKRKLTTQKFL